MNKSCFKLYLGSTYKNVMLLDLYSLYERLLFSDSRLFLAKFITNHLKALFAKHAETMNKSVEAVTSP